MKLKASTGRKLRYGSTSVAITALVIAAVIIVNVVFSLLTERFRWYIDLTPDLHFTISDECYELIEESDAENDEDSPIEMLDKFRRENAEYNSANSLSKGDEGWRDEHVSINILFCQERDVLEADQTTNYVVQNAEELRAKFPDYVTTEYKNARFNPSRFSKYLSSNTDSIASDSVIIECGTEFRIRTLRSFFVFVNDEPFGYNGEKAFASSILAVTRAEAPLACYTYNHGETIAAVEDEAGTRVYGVLQLLEDAGYKHMPIDLSRQEIPEECRILITFDPKSDFTSSRDGTSAVGEIEKLDKFLEDRNSYMVFISPETGELPQLEEFLADWGLAVRQQGEDIYRVRDAESSLLGDSAAVVATYAKNDLMDAWSESITANRSTPPMVVFDKAAALYYSPSYQRSEVEDSETGKKYSIGYNPAFPNRRVFDMFTSSTSANAWVNDREIASATKTDPFKLLAVSVESHYEQEMYTTMDDSAYVMLCGSTDFLKNKYTSSNVYGNTDFMLSALQMSGREPVPVGLDYKKFANYEIESITTEQATQYTLVLTLVPVFAALITGVFVIVRRKNR
ncbi:MAG: hypothetical protein E7642_07520 [Ruminococcaceae bacterium]|nr:hypothetical protein [Oscillospiraceae bacterium]